MKYFKIKCGNGYCGCNEEWLLQNEGAPAFADVIQLYSYLDGAVGLDIGEDDDSDISEEEYYESIDENLCMEEISKEEYLRLRDEECWDERNF